MLLQGRMEYLSDISYKGKSCASSDLDEELKKATEYELAAYLVTSRRRPTTTSATHRHQSQQGREAAMPMPKVHFPHGCDHKANYNITSFPCRRRVHCCKRRAVPTSTSGKMSSENHQRIPKTTPAPRSTWQCGQSRKSTFLFKGTA